MLRPNARPVAAVLVMTALAACSGNDDDENSGPTPPPVARSCESLAELALQNAAIDSVESVAAGTFTPPGSQAALEVPEFCRVTAHATPTNDSLINFEVWIPAGERWHGKLVVVGNGGYSPAIGYANMAGALERGYAAVGGDTGHQSSDPNDMLWAVGHPEKIVDWGTRSIHAITAASKSLLADFRGSPVDRSYFYGCSTGGHQGYAEVQRYADDFDGVIAGAPGNNRVRLNAGFMWQFLANHRPNDNTTQIIPASKLPMITEAVVAACDGNDGVVDGVIDDPRSCDFNPAVLQCTGADGADCLTGEQLAALNRMYEGARNPRTGEVVYPGWPKGSEALSVTAEGRIASGWNQYWGTDEPTRADFWRYWVFNDPQWNWWDFDFDQDLAFADAKVGAMVDQNDSDIADFKARGGKLIAFNGWQDPVVNAVDTIAYYDQVKALQGSQEETDRFFRLFMVPGMGHCSGGPGATNFGNSLSSPPPTIDPAHDLLEALDHWVENGVAPERIVASRVENDTVTMTRPLCPYPRRAVYNGTGSTNDAVNFRCQ
jgi:feruloyl esterase